MKPQVTFLARNYPPVPNINGEAVCDLVQYLKEKKGIESTVICIDKKPENNGQPRTPAGNVIRLKSFSKSENKILRFFTFLYDGYSLVKEALKHKDTLIVVTSSPPLLPFWASLLFGKKVRWAFWSLDLFPEGFAATNFISRKNIFYKWIKKKTYSASPEFLITLGPRQTEHLHQEFKQNLPYVILPCGVFFYQEKSEEKPLWYEEEKIICGYCGNVGDAHNADFIKAAIDHINPEKHLLILALYGHKAQELKQYAQGKKGIKIVETVPRNQLHFIDIHLVSLRKEWTHIAVPSKAVSAITMGQTILFCGDKGSDNWFMFQDAGWHIEEDDNMSSSMRFFLDNITIETIAEKKKFAPLLYENLKKSVLMAYDMVAEKIII